MILINSDLNLTKKLFILLVLLSGVALAGGKEKATFTATKNNPYYTSFNIFKPGTPGTSTTNCSGSATTYGNTTNASANCDTAYTAPTPSSMNTYYQLNVIVEGVLSREDGRRYEVYLWCKKGWRNCANVYLNDPHDAELDGETLWIHGKNPFAKKQLVVKYKIIRAIELKVTKEAQSVQDPNNNKTE